jgi:predicted RNA binding protein YcfA (HicA-like mRNA interferase family)
MGASVLTNGKDILRRLLAEGWEPVSTKGSHHKFRKGSQTLIVPHPKKDLASLAPPAASRGSQAG